MKLKTPLKSKILAFDMTVDLRKYLSDIKIVYYLYNRWKLRKNKKFYQEKSYLVKSYTVNNLKYQFFFLEP